MTLRIGSVCTGYGGLDMAVRNVFGGELAWVSDIDAGACQIIAHRMPGVPNLGDLTAARWEDVEPVDIYLGGYPCQPFSTAGKQKGTADERHIWPYIAGALRVLRPRIAIFENVANHLRIGFDTVLADLARLGFDAEWCLVRASEIGAPHRRERLFLLAVAADAAGLGHEWSGASRDRRHGPADRGDAAPDAARLAPEDVRELPARWDAVRDGIRDDAPRCGTPVDAEPDDAWGRFLPAVRRWEHILGRTVPRATGVGTKGQRQLSPEFLEWMMGLPAGHVTEVPGLTRNQQGHALGNGVVPQQAEAAIRLLAARAGLLGAVAA